MPRILINGRGATPQNCVPEVFWREPDGRVVPREHWHLDSATEHAWSALTADVEAEPQHDAGEARA